VVVAAGNEVIGLQKRLGRQALPTHAARASAAVLGALVESAEAAGIWTIQTGIFPEKLVGLFDSGLVRRGVGELADDVSPQSSAGRRVTRDSGGSGSHDRADQWPTVYVPGVHGASNDEAQLGRPESERAPDAVVADDVGRRKSVATEP